MNQEIQSKLEVVTTPLKSMLDAVEAIPALIDAGEQAKYNEGFEAGKAAIQLPAPNDPAAQYSQAQMNEAVNTGMAQARAEMEVQMKELKAQLDQATQAQADLQAKVDAGGADVEAAVNKRTQELIAEFEDADKDNDALVAKYKKTAEQAPDPVLGDKPTADAEAKAPTQE